MVEFFLTLLNMSLVAGWLIVALLVLRPLLKKAPRAFVCALWGLVGLRLVCPFSFESVLSLIPSSEPISKEVIITQGEHIGNLQTAIHRQSVNIISNTLASPAGASFNPMQAISLVAAFIWAVGVAVMLIISLVSFLSLKKTVSPSINTGGNVFINDEIASPFVLGIIRPKIYIPSSLTEYEKGFVIAHENAHIKRRDYLIKPLGYALLSLHWFNPLVWVAYILLCRDIESACDELVVKKMDYNGKKEYSQILLRLSLPVNKIRACPVAFGEVGVKSRVKSVLNYKKPAFWVTSVAVVLAAVLSICFLTNPISAKNEETETLEKCISKAIVDFNKTENGNLNFCVENYVELKTLTFNEDITVYIWAYYGEYQQNGDKAELVFESYKPAKVRVVKEEMSYSLVEYTAAETGNISAWAKENFPQELFESVMYTPGYYNDQKSSALEIAKEHFGISAESNELFPVFNAEVLEISEKYITVAPLKGECVSRNTFDKVRLSTKHLSSTSYSPFVGDIVRVRYVDIITVESDPPILHKVFNLDLLESKVGTELPVVVYSGGEGAYYMKEPVQDKVYALTDGNIAVWFPGSYFSVNEDKRTFIMRCEEKYEYTTDTESDTDIIHNNEGIYSEEAEHKGNIVTGSVSYEGEDMVLCADDADWLTMYFVKDGDSYVFSESKSLEWASMAEIEDFDEDDFLGFPFKNGDVFVLAEAL